MKLFSAVKRVGTHPHKFQFTLTVAAVEFSKPLGEILAATLGKEAPTDINRSAVSFVWKRGPRSATSGPQPIPGAESSIISQWGTPQTLMCTLYQDSKTGSYLSKDSEITFKTGASGDDLSKVLGVAKLDLAKYAGKENVFEDVVELAKCKDKNAKVKISILAKWLKEVAGEEDSPSVAEHEEDASMSSEEKTDSTRQDEHKAEVATSLEAVPTESAEAVKRGSFVKPDADHAKVAIILAERDDLLKQNQKLEKALNTTKAKLQKKEEEVSGVALTKQERDIAVTKVNKLSEEVKHLHSQLADVQAKYKESQELAQKEVKVLTMKQSTLTEEKNSAFTQVDKLQSLLDQEKKDHQSQNDDLKKQLADLKGKLVKRDEELASLNAIKQERDLAVAKTSKLQEELKQVTATLKDASNSNLESETWRKSYEESSHKLMAAEEKLHQMTSEFNAAKEKDRQRTHDHETEVAALKAKLSEKETEAQKLGKIQVELETRLLETQKRIQEMAEVTTSREEEVSALRRQVEETENARDEFRENLQRKSMEKDEADEEISKLKSNLQHLQEETAVMKEEMQRMREEEEETKEELSKVEAELKRAKERLLQVDGESSGFTEKMSALEKKLFEATQKLSQMQLERSQLEEVRQKLEDKKTSAEKKRDAAVKELERLQNIVGDMEVKLVNVKIELVNTVDRLNGIEVENNQLKEQINNITKSSVKKR